MYVEQTSHSMSTHVNTLGNPWAALLGLRLHHRPINTPRKHPWEPLGSVSRSQAAPSSNRSTLHVNTLGNPWAALLGLRLHHRPINTALGTQSLRHHARGGNGASCTVRSSMRGDQCSRADQNLRHVHCSEKRVCHYLP